jgi:heat shock protein HtpX
VIRYIRGSSHIVTTLRLVDQDELEGVLAHELGKLQQSAQRIPMDVSPAAAPLARVNPLSAFKRLSELFSTHPSTEERVARLHPMAAASG